MRTIRKNQLPASFSPPQTSSIDPLEMTLVLAPAPALAPPATEAPTTPDINKKGNQERKRTSRKNILGGGRRKCRANQHLWSVLLQKAQGQRKRSHQNPILSQETRSFPRKRCASQSRPSFSKTSWKRRWRNGGSVKPQYGAPNGHARHRKRR